MDDEHTLVDDESQTSVDNSTIIPQDIYALTPMTNIEDLVPAAGDSSVSIEALILYIGNIHREIIPKALAPSNRHQWTFFVRPSRADIIKEVVIFLVSAQLSKL